MRRCLPAAVLLIAACSNIASPAVTNIYDYRDIELNDTLAFHWPRSLLPVRVWVAAGSPIGQNVATAVERWQNAFLYGEFRATLVTDSATADVIVRNDISDIGGGGISAVAPQCVGETDLDIDPDAHTLRLPIHVFMFAVVSGDEPGTATCFSITMTHEIGHAIGILAHSPHNDDVMFANPVVDGVSDRDRQTAVTLYHQPATVTVIGRR